MREEGALKLIGRVAVPLVLYGLLAMMYPTLMGAVSGGRLLRPEAGMWLLTAGNLMMLPVFWLLYRRERKQKGGQPFRIRDLILLIFGTVCISRGVNDFLALTFLPRLFPGYERLTEEILAGSLFSQLAAGVLSAPLLEEVLMRGVIYGRLREEIKNPRTAMLFSALIFGLFHGNVVQGIYAFVLGLFFALLFEVYDSLLPAILAHMAANLTSIVAAGTEKIFFLHRNLGLYCLMTAGVMLAGMVVFRYFWRRL